MRKITLLILAFAYAFFWSCNKGSTETQHESWKPTQGADIIGKKAPEFEDLIWVNSKPLTLSALRGKPVFVRFWLGECSMCRESVHALNYLQKTYTPKGLVVIGIHHPKGRTSLVSPDKVKRLMDQWGITYAVALDNDWKTLKRFWTDKPRDYTSGSVLIDGNGIIRWVHPGGVLKSKDSPEFESLELAINKALSEKAQPLVK